MILKNDSGHPPQHISTVLHAMAAQENCDGEPYDTMIIAADYIKVLERQKKELNKLLYEVCQW